MMVLEYNWGPRVVALSTGQNSFYETEHSQYFNRAKLVQTTKNKMAFSNCFHPFDI